MCPVFLKRKLARNVETLDVKRSRKNKAERDNSLKIWKQRLFHIGEWKKQCDSEPAVNTERIPTLMDMTDLYIAILVPLWHTFPVRAHTYSQHVPLLQWVVSFTGNNQGGSLTAGITFITFRLRLFPKKEKYNHWMYFRFHGWNISVKFIETKKKEKENINVSSGREAHRALVYMPMGSLIFTLAVYKQNAHKSDLDAIVILKGARSLPYSLQGQIPRQTLEGDVHSFWAEQWWRTVNRGKGKKNKKKTTC